MHEIIINLHIHTLFSDGSYTHAGIAQAAMDAGLDAVIITDHNVFVKGQEGYYIDGNRKVLLMIGEEIHDQTRIPQKNHLLVFGANRELAPYAKSPQYLIDTVRRNNGLAFLAHPVDPAAPAFGEGDISWDDWDIHGYTGLELWNGFSEFKSRLKTKIHGIFFAFFPQFIARGPHPKIIKKWDELLARGVNIVAIAGSDAHALAARLGPLRRTIFPYVFHFKGINTHVFIREKLIGESEHDAKMILDALAAGRCFLAYDLPAPTRGFRFTASGNQGNCWMGETMQVMNGVTMQIRLPFATECKLLKNGTVVKSWKNRAICTYITTEPGFYRVEAYISFLGRQRGWIFSNPIYLLSDK